MSFKDKVVYQIYPRSFCDTNGDGLGDLRGVIEKLDYLGELGVDYIWLTPIYVSPQNDNGYDIANYYLIDPRWGTMADFEELVRKAKEHHIEIMLDMVFNHTSTDCEWFQKALMNDPQYKDYYIWKKGKPDGTPPTNWESKFGGNAWEYVPALDEYYLHLFDVTQADLNWENPAVREEAQKVCRFWMAKGVKGFRFDVVNLISKAGYEDDDEGDGRRFYTDGPRVHEYLNELNTHSFGLDPDIITVGEMSSTTLENCYGYAGASAHELSMVFSFHHLKVDFAGNEKWVIVPTDFMKLKKILYSWQTGMQAHDAWNALFWCCHDQPRVVSRFGDDGAYWQASAKMLATLMHGMRGTPYIYQGEELGMTNADFTRIEEFRDVESLNYYQILQDKGLTASDALRIVQIHSRDNARTPMQWDDTPQAGFTTGTPWIDVNHNYQTINAKKQLADPTSNFHYYKELIRLRKTYPVIAEGSIAPLLEKHPTVFAYERRYENQSMIVLCNFYKTPVKVMTGKNLSDYQILLSNYDHQDIQGEQIDLKPYEAIMLYREDAAK